MKQIFFPPESNLIQPIRCTKNRQSTAGRLAAAAKSSRHKASMAIKLVEAAKTDPDSARRLTHEVIPSKPAPRKPVDADMDEYEARNAHWLKVDVMLKDRKPIKRALSQIKFQHWWKEQPWLRQFSNAEATPIDTQKAAAIYESMRRRPEVQRAWLEHRDGIGANGYQPFAGLIVSHLRQAWVALDDVTQHTLIKEIRSPFFVPPWGYSTFPDKTAGREKQREAAFRVLQVPRSDTPAELQQFAAQARRLAEAGFLIVAINNKSGQSVRYACEAIESGPRSVRQADLIQVSTCHLPPGLPRAAKKTLEEKRKAGTLTIHDLGQTWSNYDQEKDRKRLRKSLARGKRLEQFNAEDEAREQSSWEDGRGSRPLIDHPRRIFGKRRARGVTVEERLFNFTIIFRELEQLDEGVISHSDFVQRLRLS